MRILLLLISLLFFATPASATYTISTPDTGGEVMTYLRFWEHIAQSNEDVVIDAPCISACTFFLGIIPKDKVCITPRASLGVHEASNDGIPNSDFSAAFFRWLYPVWVQQWIKDHGGLKDELMYMYPEDLKDHIPLCPGYNYYSISPGDLIHQDELPPQR